MKITDLISKEELNKYMRIFADGFNIIAVISEIDGTPITDYIHFTEVCLNYHRKYPKSAKKCLESDKKLGLKAAENREIFINPCGCGGLVDAVVPIIVNNEHIGNVLTGQVLFEKPDLEEYKKLAKEFEIDDVEGYLQAIEKVKIVTKDELLKVANSLKIYIEMIFSSAYEKNKSKQLAEYYSNLFYNLPVAANIYALDGKRTEVAKATSKMFGYSIDELKTEDYSMYSSEDIKKLNKAFELAKQGQDSCAEVIVNRKDKSSFPILVNYSPIKDKDGKVINIVGTGTDISESKNLQEYYKSIFYYLPNPTSLNDVDGRRIDFSLEAERMYRYKKEEILSIPLEKLYKKEDSYKIQDAIKNAVNGKKTLVETIAYRGDKTEFPVLLSFYPVKDKSNKVINILASATDLTDIKEREQEYQKATEEITRTIEYIAANEFDNFISTNYKCDDLQLMTGAFNEVLKYLKQSGEDLNNLIKELATPAIEVTNGVIVMPIVGRLTSDRATDAMKTILNKINVTNAKVGIIDITGVPSIDSAVADSLIKTLETIKLVGAEPILCGISPEVATNLVRMGIDFKFVTKSKLSDALDYINRQNNENS